MQNSVDVAIVGGGAAGIAAARTLAAARRSVVIVEALSALGGRARTRTLAGMPFDLGCGWMHSAERNPLARLAAQQGLALDRSEAAWRRQLDDIGFPREDREAAWKTWSDLDERLRQQPPPSDRVGDALPRDHRWRAYIDAVSSFINGAELDRLSARDYLAYDDAATEENWRIAGGYGAFVAGLGDDLPVALETQVTSVAEDAMGVQLETDRGTIRASAAIVSASTAILASGRIRFTPAADEHLHAAGKLPLGLADKVFFSLGNPDSVPSESHLLAHSDRVATGSYYLRPFGRPVVECFLGGAHALALEEAGEAAAIAFCIDELRDLLGDDFAGGLTPLAVTRWAHEPTVLGSYSHALPGNADARVTLASPVSERLCFAGEACSTHDFSTAHGAWQSGIAAAEWIDRHL